MSLLINTNMGSILSSQHFNNYSNNIDKAVSSIASGQKFNHAGDFLDGGAQANRFLMESTALIKNLEQIKNGLALADRAERALESGERMLQRMRELVVQSSNGTFLTRSGIAEYSPATATFDITAGTPGTFASGSLNITGATDGSNANATMAISGAVAGNEASGTIAISNAVDAVYSSGSFRVTGGSPGGSGSISGINVGSTDLLGGNTVNSQASNSSTASAIRTAINNRTGTTGYSAGGSGNQITITAGTANPSFDGNLSFTTSGDFSTGSVNNVTGGVVETSTTINDFVVNGVDLLNVASVTVEGDSSEIAQAIVSNADTTNYTVTRSGNNVVVTSRTKTTAHNGFAVSTTLSDNGAGSSASASSTSLSGGVTTSVHTVNSVQVNGVALFSGSLNVSGDNASIAQAIVDANTNGDYTLTRSGNNVVITSNTRDTSQNGYSTSMSFTKTAGATTASSTNPNLSGGLTPSTNVLQVSIAGTQIHDSNITVSGGNNSVAEAIKNAVNSSTTSPNFSASRSGSRVTFTSAVKLTDDNGDVISMNRVSGVSNAASATNSTLSGGDTPTNNQIVAIQVSGTRINDNNITHTGNNNTTAAAVAAEINNSTTNRNYTASSSGTRVTIYSNTEPYWVDNDRTLSVSVKGTAAVGNVAATLDGSIRTSGGALTLINNKIQSTVTDYETEIQAAKFNGKTLFDGSSYSFQTGQAQNNNAIATPVFNFTGLNEETLDITVNAAPTSLAYLDTTMDSVDNVRSQYAAFANRLEAEIDFLSESIVSNASSLSKIMDTDLALKTLNLTKNQVLKNSALFALAQTAPTKGEILSLYYDSSKVSGQGSMFLGL